MKKEEVFSQTCIRNHKIYVIARILHKRRFYGKDTSFLNSLTKQKFNKIAFGIIILFFLYESYGSAVWAIIFIFQPYI